VDLPLPHHSARRRVRPEPERLRYLDAADRHQRSGRELGRN
jgi:hypothetical protein